MIGKVAGLAQKKVMDLSKEKMAEMYSYIFQQSKMKVLRL